MTDKALTADVTADLSDDKIDKYFETSGKETIETEADAPEQEQAEIKQEAQEQTDASSSEKQKEPEKQAEFERNYKAAMHEERERRKELQRQLDEQRHHSARLEQTFQKVLDRTHPQQQQPVPDYNADPIEALRYNQEQLQRALIQQHQTLEQRQQHELHQQRLQQFVGQYQRSAEEYRETQKDFNDAYKFLRDARKMEYRAAGYSPEQADQLFIDDELAVASKAYQDNVNPASRIYEIAKMRGYQHKQAEAPKVDNKTKVDMLEKGARVSKSLSTVGGKAENELSLESLASMDSDELDSYLDSHWNKIMKMG